MLLSLSDLSPEPLHRQIFDQVRAQILAGDLGADDPLPSIRGLAREQRVSVITVQRAYDDLERAGLIRTRRGKGCFVARLGAERRIGMAEATALDALEQAVSRALTEGLEPQRVRELVERILRAREEGS